MDNVYNTRFTFDSHDIAIGFEKGINWIADDNITVNLIRQEGVKWVVYVLDLEDDDPTQEIPPYPTR